MSSCAGRRLDRSITRRVRHPPGRWRPLPLLGHAMWRDSGRRPSTPQDVDTQGDCGNRSPTAAVSEGQEGSTPDVPSEGGDTGISAMSVGSPGWVEPSVEPGCPILAGGAIVAAPQRGPAGARQASRTRQPAAAHARRDGNPAGVRSGVDRTSAGVLGWSHRCSNGPAAGIRQPTSGHLGARARRDAIAGPPLRCPPSPAAAQSATTASGPVASAAVARAAGPSSGPAARAGSSSLVSTTSPGPSASAAGVWHETCCYTEVFRPSRLAPGSTGGTVGSDADIVRRLPAAGGPTGAPASGRVASGVAGTVVGPSSPLAASVPGVVGGTGTAAASSSPVASSAPSASAMSPGTTRSAAATGATSTAAPGGPTASSPGSASTLGAAVTSARTSTLSAVPPEPTARVTAAIGLPAAIRRIRPTAPGGAGGANGSGLGTVSAGRFDSGGEPDHYRGGRPGLGDRVGLRPGNPGIGPGRRAGRSRGLRILRVLARVRRRGAGSVPAGSCAGCRRSHPGPPACWEARPFARTASRGRDPARTRPYPDPDGRPRAPDDRHLLRGRWVPPVRRAGSHGLSVPRAPLPALAHLARRVRARPARARRVLARQVPSPPPRARPPRAQPPGLDGGRFPPALAQPLRPRTGSGTSARRWPPAPGRPGSPGSPGWEHGCRRPGCVSRDRSGPGQAGVESGRTCCRGGRLRVGGCHDTRATELRQLRATPAATELRQATADFGSSGGAASHHDRRRGDPAALRARSEGLRAMRARVGAIRPSVRRPPV